MERLTSETYKSLAESYNIVYNEDLRERFEEEKNINEFLEVIDQLVEEGYDLSEYTYDELYENYLSEAGLGAALGLGARLLRPLVQGAKGPTKEVLTRVGKAIVPTAIAAGLDQFITGGKGREYAGAAVQGLRQIGHSIPSPQQLAVPSAPKSTDTAKPNKKSASSDPWSSVPSNLRQSYDPFDVIKGHLLDEGYADTEEAALAIMANMSEDWRQSIVEAEVLAAKGGVPGTVQVNKTKEGGFLGIGAQTVSKPVPGTFRPSTPSSSAAARYNVGVDRRFGGAAPGQEPTRSALSTQTAAQRSGHSGYMQVRDPGSLPNTGLPGRPSPGRASDQNFAIGKPRNY